MYFQQLASSWPFQVEMCCHIKDIAQLVVPTAINTVSASNLN